MSEYWRVPVTLPVLQQCYNEKNIHVGWLVGWMDEWMDG